MDMLKQHAAQLAALGHPVRLAILRYVVEVGPKGVATTEIQEQLEVPWTTLNHHLVRLVRTGLIKVRREGRLSLHTTDFVALRELTDFLWKDCCKRGRAGSGCC
jgi:DNA-binding transcriptional ArsR family regulator